MTKAHTSEWACVPDVAMPCTIPAATLLVPSKPPMYEYRDADMAPSGPCARRRPNSMSVFVGPAARRKRAAFVATSDA